MVASGALGDDNGAGKITVTFGPSITAFYTHIVTIIFYGDILIAIEIIAVNRDPGAHRAIIGVEIDVSGANGEVFNSHYAVTIVIDNIDIVGAAAHISNRGTILHFIRHSEAGFELAELVNPLTSDALIDFDFIVNTITHISVIAGKIDYNPDSFRGIIVRTTGVETLAININVVADFAFYGR
jgi:hypothetical protein